MSPKFTFELGFVLFVFFLYKGCKNLNTSFQSFKVYKSKTKRRVQIF